MLVVVVGLLGLLTNRAMVGTIIATYTDPDCDDGMSTSVQSVLHLPFTRAEILTNPVPQRQHNLGSAAEQEANYFVCSYAVTHISFAVSYVAHSQQDGLLCS